MTQECPSSQAGPVYPPRAEGVPETNHWPGRDKIQIPLGLGRGGNTEHTPDGRCENVLTHKLTTLASAPPDVEGGCERGKNWGRSNRAGNRRIGRVRKKEEEKSSRAAPAAQGRCCTGLKWPK